MNPVARRIALRALGYLAQTGSVNPQSERDECVAAARHAVRVGDVTAGGAWTAAMLALEYLPAIRAEQAASDMITPFVEAIMTSAKESRTVTMFNGKVTDIDELMVHLRALDILSDVDCSEVDGGYYVIGYMVDGDEFRILVTCP